MAERDMPRLRDWHADRPRGLPDYTYKVAYDEACAVLKQLKPET